MTFEELNLMNGGGRMLSIIISTLMIGNTEFIILLKVSSEMYNIVIHTFKDYISFIVIIKYWLYSFLESYFHMPITHLPI